MTVATTWSGMTAVLTLDNPPVNAGNIALRRDLQAALLAASTEPDLAAIVIESAGRHFYSGSDISEFDRPLEEPQLPAVISLIERIPVPVVAAIRGFALGGGFELALGCDARVGDNTATLGFPEVTLGMIPGAGGTVRGARLLGPETAIDLVSSARQVKATEAADLGILDLVVAPDILLEEAVAYASRMPGKRRLTDLGAPPSDASAVCEAAAAASRRARPNVVEAVEMVRRGIGMDAKDALVEERAIFNRLRVESEASNLRYLFFAKRAAAGSLRSTARPRSIHRVGIAGAGTMGARISRLFHQAGYSVTVFDTNDVALHSTTDGVSGITTATDVHALADCDLVIDAVFEDMGVKQALLAELEAIVSDETTIASNTSYLDLDEMASALQHPKRFAGLHFFNPADRNPLLEIVRPRSADDQTIATLGATAGKLGKVAILAGVGDGFIANRIYSDYRLQAEFLVEDGAGPEDVDRAMSDLGLSIGPFAVADMSGLDIAWARRKRLAATRDPRARYVTIADTLCQRGRLGKKTSAGWYAYSEDAPRGAPDSEVSTIIDEARSAKGIAPRDIEIAEIQQRAVMSMVCAAVAIMQSGVAQRPSDIDVAMTEGFAFPRWLGGPLRYAASLSAADTVHALAAVHQSDPVHFAMARSAVDGEVPDAVGVLLDSVRS